MIVVGITGTLGAGKGTVVEYLVNEKNFVHYSVRAFLIEEIKNRKMPINRDSMVLVANDLRKLNSPSYITDTLLQKALQSKKNAVIESIRSIGEVNALRKQANFILLAVDAEAGLRYQRIQLRNSETDRISFEVFKENEIREFSNEDPNQQNLSKCIQMADFVLTNNKTIHDLHVQVEKIIQKIKHQNL